MSTSANVHPETGKPVDPLDNTIVGKYRIEKTIGQGTYGKVKLGVHVETNEKVAIKVIEKANISSEKQVARIQREIRFLKLLHQPHIVKVFEVIENQQHIYISMEFAKGGELFDYIVANKRLKDKEARHFFRQIISAVDYCHKNSVIHRDLKPENLLLDEHKNIKIIDFGFGNTFRSNALLDTFCGSPFYAAPEMILGRRYEGPEVDLWSLGVILFALLCGHLPFDDENVKELYRRISTGSYRIPDHLNSSSRHLISRMICVDPKKRATLEEVKRHPWLNDGYKSIPESMVPERPLLDAKKLNKDVMQRLLAFNYQPEEIASAFDDPKSNPIKNTYYLLCEMLQREDRRVREERKKMARKLDKGKSTASVVSKTSLFSIGEDGVASKNLKEHHATYSSMPQDLNPSRERRISSPDHRVGATGSEHVIVTPSQPQKPAIAYAPGSYARAYHQPSYVYDDDDDMADGNSTPAYHEAGYMPTPPPQAKRETNAAHLTEDDGNSSNDSDRSDNRRRFSLPSLSFSAKRSPSTKDSAKSGVDPNGIRMVNSWFLNVASTSSREPLQLLEDIKAAVEKYRLKHAHETAWTVRCESANETRNPLVFEIEICRVPKLSLYGLHFKRLNGNIWAYKKLCSRLLTDLAL